MSGHTHQLVIQFPEVAFPEFDALVRFEDALCKALSARHEVDGHDIGSGEVNFFVLTDDPGLAFSEVRKAMGESPVHPDVRAAARPIDGEDYEPVWPIGDTRTFTVR